jgi:catechol 2,3-dioxygenase-like lactoylglutathione lyase family enzyme
MDSQMNQDGAFRFTYFTGKYEETVDFYAHKLGFPLVHSWDRNRHDKGALFKAEAGLIEVLLRPDDEANRYAGLDYRDPQGAFMCIQVSNIDALFSQHKDAGIPFRQDITDQSWGHRSFSVMEPNGLILFFFQEQF